MKEDSIALPNGDKTHYVYFGKIPDTATIIAVNDSGKILVQKEYSYPTSQLLYQFPGGAIEKSETEAEGAARELAEEANLKGSLVKIGSYLTNNRRSTHKQHVFLATNLAPCEGEKDAEEVFEEYWLSEKEISKMIKEGDIFIASALSAWAIYTNR